MNSIPITHELLMPELSSQATSSSDKWQVELDRAPIALDLQRAAKLFGSSTSFFDRYAEHDLQELDQLSVLVDKRDDSTGKHAQRVGALSRMFAVYLGLSDKAATAIERAARLHDIGKVFVPDRILLKPGPLDSMERRLMEQHVMVGAQLLSGSSEPARLLARLIARLHHEAWDGNGYPYHLAGEHIPFIVRLVTLVDVFDALVNERPYKPAWSCDTALSWMGSRAGRQFDPALTLQFLNFMQPHRAGFPALFQQADVAAINPGI